MLVQPVLAQDPFSGHLFVFRGRCGDLIKVLWWDGQTIGLVVDFVNESFCILRVIASLHCNARAATVGYMLSQRR
jgi:hypothetical protein